MDEDTEFRCKDCGGRGEAIQAEDARGGLAYWQVLKADSEYCRAGTFLKATDGREGCRF